MFLTNGVLASKNSKIYLPFFHLYRSLTYLTKAAFGTTSVMAPLLNLAVIICLGLFLLNSSWPTWQLPTLFPLPVAVKAPVAGPIVGTGVV